MAFLPPLPVSPRPSLSPPLLHATAPHYRTASARARAHLRMSKLVTTPPQAAELVDSLLTKVQNTDSGLSVSGAQRSEIDSIIRSLMEIGKSQTPMSDPRLFAKYTVAYTSTNDPSNPDQSPPAGGLFRSRLGRLVFVTRGLFQHVFAPDTVVNLVCFRVLGVVKGCVSLRGKLVPIEDEKLGENAIKVTFERPRLRLGGLVFQFGPRSNVKLATTYVDDRVRLAVGGRGSLFVFQKGAEAESAVGDEWNELFQAQTMPVVILPVLVLGGVALAFLAPWPVWVAAVVVALIFGFVLKRGGIAHNATSVIKEDQ